jgi:hypothetical protein
MGADGRRRNGYLHHHGRQKIAKGENKASTSLMPGYPGYKVRDIGDLEDIEVNFDPVQT